MVASLRDDRPALLGCWLVAIHSFVTVFSAYVSVRDVLRVTENSVAATFLLVALVGVSLLISLLPCGLLLFYFLKPSREPKRAKLISTAFFIWAAMQFVSLSLNLINRGDEAVDPLSIAITVAYAVIYLLAGIDTVKPFKWVYLTTILLCVRTIVPIVTYGETLYVLFAQGSDVLPTLGSAVGALLLPIGMVLLTLSFKKSQTV